jgi:two-component system sensor histidine kinase TctE
MTALRLALALALLAGAARAEAPILYPAPEPETGRLLVHAATDRAFMEPLLRDFQALEPGIAITYLEASSNALYLGVATPHDGPVADVVISSAVDLQIKLVNDGLTRSHRSPATAALPDWANWRDEAFGFTFEPVVIAYNRELLPEAAGLRTRLDLIRLLRAEPERFRGRVVTYDLESSGTGYLFAGHDAVLSSQFWQLAAALGGAHPRLVGSTGEMLDALAQGAALLAYNVIGPYARARQLEGAPIGILMPSDYTLVLSRVAVIPRAAAHPELAGRLVDYLLSERAQAISGGLFAPGALVPDGAQGEAILQPITLGPALLVFADPMRRRRLVADWRLAISAP